MGAYLLLDVAVLRISLSVSWNILLYVCIVDDIRSSSTRLFKFAALAELH